MNQSAEFRCYGNNAEEMTGEEHVSHQYHLNPAGSSTDYRHSGCSEVIDARFCSSFVNFDDGFHHALLSEYIDLRYSPEQRDRCHAAEIQSGHSSNGCPKRKTKLRELHKGTIAPSNSESRESCGRRWAVCLEVIAFWCALAVLSEAPSKRGMAHHKQAP